MPQRSLGNRCLTTIAASLLFDFLIASRYSFAASKGGKNAPVCVFPFNGLGPGESIHLTPDEGAFLSTASASAEVVKGGPVDARSH